MGNSQTSGAGARNRSSPEPPGTPTPDQYALFRKQSMRKSSIGCAPSANVSRAKRFMERELNKSHSLHDLDVNGSGKKSATSASLKNRRQSTANDSTSATRKHSIVPRLSNNAALISASNSNCNSRASPAPFAGAGGVVYGDPAEDQYINGFGSTMASSSPTSSTNALHHGRASSTNASTTASARQKSVKRSEAAAHPITQSGREIIQFCFENAPLDFGTRLFTRVYEKRPDFLRFSQQMGREKWYAMAHGLREFLQRAIANIDKLEAVERIARKYGEDHLPLKSYGFKPDFWVTMADLLTMEGVMLDQATHTHTDAMTAWSLFISILFSSIRDGYYSAMREQRNSIRKKSSVRAVGAGLSPGATTPPTAGLQQLQIPTADALLASASGTPSPTASSGAGGDAPQRRASRGSMSRVAGNGHHHHHSASRKSSIASGAGSENSRRQSPANG